MQLLIIYISPFQPVGGGLCENGEKMSVPLGGGIPPSSTYCQDTL